MERWLSGRRHRSRKAAGSQGSRGFKSLPLRQKIGVIIKSHADHQTRPHLYFDKNT